jgi:hypothetical protein
MRLPKSNLFHHALREIVCCNCPLLIFNRLAHYLCRIRDWIYYSCTSPDLSPSCLTSLSPITAPTYREYHHYFSEPCGSVQIPREYISLFEPPSYNSSLERSGAVSELYHSDHIAVSSSPIVGALWLWLFFRNILARHPFAHNLSDETSSPLPWITSHNLIHGHLCHQYRVC